MKNNRRSPHEQGGGFQNWRQTMVDQSMQEPASAGFNPFSPAFTLDPAPIYKRLQNEEPVFFYEPLNCWVITKYEDIQTVLRDYATFSSRATGVIQPPIDLEPLVPDLKVEEIVITIDPPQHATHRNVMARSFTPAVIAQMGEFITKAANELIDGMIERGEADLMKAYAVPLTMNTIVKLLGLPPEHKEKYKKWTDDYFYLFTPRITAGGEASEMRQLEESDLRARWISLAEANRFFADYADQRLAEPGNDIISAMLQAKGADGEPAISKSAVVRHLISLVGAGHDTTANTIGNVIYHLCAAPGQRDLLVADPSLAANAVEEGLRMRTPVPGLLRVTTKAVEMSGVTIPANSLVYILIPAGGHDVKMFDDSLNFDISRSNAEQHMGFGVGRHSCLGSSLARQQAKIAIAELFRRIPDLALKPGYQRSYLPMMTVSHLLELPTVWQPGKA
jgi:cytochrome P450